MTGDPHDLTHSGQPHEAAPTIFVSDASAEAERLAAALRGRGYAVVDVPLSLLVARVAVQRPALILLDVDADGALESAARLRDVPGAGGIDILFVGEPGKVLADNADALRREGSGFFVRPVDVYALVAKVEALAGVRPHEPAPVSIRQAGPRVSSSPPSRPSGPFASLGPSPLAPHSSVPAPPSSSNAHTGETHTLAGSPPQSHAPSSRTGATVERGLTPSRGITGLLHDKPPSNALPSPPLAPFASLLPPATSPGTRDHPPSSPPSAHLADPNAWGLAGPTPSRVPHASLSPEVESLLRSAEDRLGQEVGPPSQPPSPEEEVEAVLPADVLAALDEPIDNPDDDDDISDSGAGSTPAKGATGSREGSTGAGTHSGGTHSGTPTPPHGRVPTSAGTPAPPTGVGSDHPISPNPAAFGARSFAVTPAGRAPERADGREADLHDLETPKPPRRGAGSLPPIDVPSAPRTPDVGRVFETNPGTPTPPPASPVAERAPPTPRPSPPPPAVEAESARGAAAPVVLEAVLGPGRGLRALAACVAQRASGALCLETDEGIRRVVLREGDIVTAASGIDEESLVAFLCARGDLSREIGQRLKGKLPAYGRHAGAALIAHGHVGQDELWPVLRAHAEWIIGSCMLAEKGTATLDAEPPGRLKAEPSVFGGATGAEVLVEVARRVVPPEASIARLGGPSARLADGPRAELLAECALPEPEPSILARSKGATLAEALASAPAPELATVIYALVELGVLEALSSGGAASAAAPSAFDPLDAEALRERVRARLGLVEEGDYFALLGVARSATAYEIRRAYLELRRAFEPGRALTAATADLAEDLRLIIEVLDEAHEILRDQTRRERYRRAIEAAPR